jgi:hypothetical protein
LEEEYKLIKGASIIFLVFYSFNLSAYRKVLILWSAELEPGEIQAIIIILDLTFPFD